MEDHLKTLFVDESSIWTLRGGLYHNRRKSSCPKANTVWGRGSDKVPIWVDICWDGYIPYQLIYYL